jgi:SAM-dependent methyltransferase
MSRLDSFLRRLSAQRDILNHISAEISAMPGDILELGLGNGRTYDHLRELFAAKRIVGFDRVERSFQGSTPQPEDMIVGEIRQTAQPFIGGNAALVHADIGTGHDDLDAVTLTWLPDLVAGALAPGGFGVSGLPLRHPDLVEQPRLDTVPQDRYFYYRRAG